MKTEAAILVETGKPLEIVMLETPALKNGQVLVEVAYSGACHTQVLEARGYRGEDRWVPHCLGHEGTGVVVECGPGVTKVAPGDQVVLSWLKGGGIEAGGAVYDLDGKRVNAGGVTTFQRHAVVSENRLSRLPEELPMDLGVLLGCAAPTGMGAVTNVLSLAAGQSLAIFGVGGVGLQACVAAALAGANPIIAVDPNEMRRVLAKAFGATHVIDPAEGKTVEAIRDLTPGGLDAAVEATGLPAVMAEALAAVRPQGGRAVVIGNCRHGERLTLDPKLFNEGKSLLGTWGGDTRPDRDFPGFARNLLDRFDLRRLLSPPYRLYDINTALDDLAAGRVGRPLIDMKLG